MQVHSRCNRINLNQLSPSPPCKPTLKTPQFNEYLYTYKVNTTLKETDMMGSGKTGWLLHVSLPAGTTKSSETEMLLRWPALTCAFMVGLCDGWYC